MINNLIGRRWFRTLVLAAICTSHSQQSAAQAEGPYNWWNPATSSTPVIGGRYWQKDLSSFYDRLPLKAAQSTRPAVFHLSHNSAGEYIDFITHSPVIRVRYKVESSYSMPHMPATGVSGVDLYALDSTNNWHWASGRYSFGDSIEYRFSQLANSESIKSFRLYLPLYNTISWLEIGVPATEILVPLQADNRRPIVLYGTSILQGACASRAGMAWTNILGRQLNLPLINLGFSGNGRLEPAITDLINEIDARLFVLDCMPNLYDRKRFPRGDVKQRILASVKSLRSLHPQTPILLVEHSGGLPGSNLDTAIVHRYKWSSSITAEAYAELKEEGMGNLYLLTDAEIGLNSDGTVDGTHPNDYGMVKYADAYENIIRRMPGLLDRIE